MSKRYAIFGAGNIGFGVIEKLIERSGKTDVSEVVVFDIKKPDYLTELIEHKSNITFREVNATDEESVEKVLSVMNTSFDVVILTVGVSSHHAAFDNFEDFRKTVNINFLGNIVPIRVLIRHKLVKNRIIVLASTSGYFAGVVTNAYASSKWMLVNACDSIRSELKEQGIYLNLISPRTIKNERSDEFKTDNGITVDFVVETILKTIFGGGTKSIQYLYSAQVWFCSCYRAA